MVLSGKEQTILRRIFALLADDLGEREIRLNMGAALLDLLRADHFASFIWDAAAERFADCVAINMDQCNLARYDAWYQFRDPITFGLQARRQTTIVSEILPHPQLRRTEFFNDFLAVDGLHWGINLHAFHSGAALGDLRIWRGRHREEFARHDKDLLALIEPAFIAALERSRRPRLEPPPVSIQETLPSRRMSHRESEVAERVCRGQTDKEIAAALGISVSSVRTYLRRLFDKFGVQRRSGLSQLARHLQNTAEPRQ